jgi:hypothetical protein
MTPAWAGLFLVVPGAVITSAYRSAVEQQSVRSVSALGLSRFPAAPVGQSLHQQNRAVDVVMPAAFVRAVAAELAQFGIRWGREEDPIHFEV